MQRAGTKNAAATGEQKNRKQKKQKEKFSDELCWAKFHGMPVTIAPETTPRRHAVRMGVAALCSVMTCACACAAAQRRVLDDLLWQRLLMRLVLVAIFAVLRFVPLTLV